MFRHTQIIIHMFKYTKQRTDPSMYLHQTTMKATDHTFQIKQSFCGMCVSQAAQQIFKKLLFV